MVLAYKGNLCDAVDAGIQLLRQRADDCKVSILAPFFTASISQFGFDLGPSKSRMIFRVAILRDAGALGMSVV